MAISSTQQQQILQLTVGIFGASPGTVYMNDFANYILINGGTTQSLAGAMFATTAGQSSAFYPSFLTADQFADKFIDNLIGTSATEAAKDEAKAEVASRITTSTSSSESVKRGEAAYWAITALAAVEHTDAKWGAAAAQFDNKVEVAEYYTITKSGDSTDVATLQATIADVTDDHATVVTAEANIDTGGEDQGGAGLTIVLTTGTDAITAGTGADTINAAIGTLQNGDSIDGKAGVDTLTVRDAAAAGGLATIRNVEQIHLINLDSAALNLADATGYTSLDVWGNGGGSAVISNIGSGLTLTIGVLSGFGGELTVGFQDEGNANDTLNLMVNNASAFGLNESAHSIETINVQAAGSGVAITAVAGSSLSTFAITGTANVTLELDRQGSTAGMTINATALAGNLTLTIHSRLGADAFTAGEFSINAGTGDDVINISPAYSSMNTLDSSLKIDGGAGTDTLRVGAESGVQLIPTAINFENLQFIAFTGAGGETAGLNFTSLTGSLASIAMWGDATSVEMVGMTAGVTVEVKSGFGGDLKVGLANEIGTADSITIIANQASGFEFHETAHGIETINFQVTNSGYVGSASEFGTATTTFNVSGSQSATMRLNANSANTSLVISSTGLTAGGLNLTIDAASGNQQLTVTFGTGADTLTLGSGVFHANLTATVDGGEGADTYKMVIETAGTLAPSISNVETLTLTFDNSGGTFDASGVSGATTLNVLMGSALASASFMTKLPSSITTLTLASMTSSSGSTAAMSLAFAANPGAVSLSINGSSQSAVTAAFGTVTLASATMVTVVANGSNNINMNDLNVDQATALTVTMGASGVDLRMSALSANNAGSVTINATAGDINIGTAGFHTANTVTINQAGGTGSYSGSYIGNLSAARADVTITVAGASGSSTTAGLIVSTADIRDDLSITTNGGDVIIGELRMGLSAVASSLSGLRLTIAANGSADYVAIARLGVDSGAAASAATAGTFNLTLTISGSGDVTLGVISFTGLTASPSAATANVINATGLFGTLIVGASATIGTGGNANFTVSLGDDQASANNISLGAGNDTINGGASKDTIEAGAGQDTLRGGGGSDVFVFLASAGDDNADQLLSAQSDFIMDFGSGDVIVFSGVVQLTSLAGFTSLSGLTGTPSAISTATLVGQGLVTASYLAIFQASGNTYIEVSVNSGAAVSDSAIVTIVLDGLSGWTALSSVFNVSVGASGLYIQHV